MFQGRPDDLGPYSTRTTNDPSPVGHPGDDPLVFNGAPVSPARPTSAHVRRNCSTYTKELVKYWHARGVNPTPDLVTTSGSGYDPDISEQDAIVQIPMVSKATGISPSTLQELIVQ